MIERDFFYTFPLFPSIISLDSLWSLQWPPSSTKSQSEPILCAKRKTDWFLCHFKGDLPICTQLQFTHTIFPLVGHRKTLNILPCTERVTLMLYQWKNTVHFVSTGTVARSYAVYCAQRQRRVEICNDDEIEMYCMSHEEKHKYFRDYCTTFSALIYPYFTDTEWIVCKNLFFCLMN
jgi:hypothetical protein